MTVYKAINTTLSVCPTTVETGTNLLEDGNVGCLTTTDVAYVCRIVHRLNKHNSTTV